MRAVLPRAFCVFRRKRPSLRRRAAFRVRLSVLRLRARAAAPLGTYCIALRNTLSWRAEQCVSGGETIAFLQPLCLRGFQKGRLRADGGAGLTACGHASVLRPNNRCGAGVAPVGLRPPAAGLQTDKNHFNETCEPSR